VEVVEQGPSSLKTRNSNLWDEFVGVSSEENGFAIHQEQVSVESIQRNDLMGQSSGLLNEVLNHEELLQDSVIETVEVASQSIQVEEIQVYSGKKNFWGRVAQFFSSKSKSSESSSKQDAVDVTVIPVQEPPLLSDSGAQPFKTSKTSESVHDHLGGQVSHVVANETNPIVKSWRSFLRRSFLKGVRGKNGSKAVEIPARETGEDAMTHSEAASSSMVQSSQSSALQDLWSSPVTHHNSGQVSQDMPSTAPVDQDQSSSMGDFSSFLNLFGSDTGTKITQKEAVLTTKVSSDIEVSADISSEAPQIDESFVIPPPSGVRPKGKRASLWERKSLLVQHSSINNVVPMDKIHKKNTRRSSSDKGYLMMTMEAF
jgi:hypothetical protein